jgi:hypothetical protein
MPVMRLRSNIEKRKGRYLSAEDASRMSRARWDATPADQRSRYGRLAAIARWAEFKERRETTGEAAATQPL